MQKIRWMDKLIDELAEDKTMVKILRTAEKRVMTALRKVSWSIFQVLLYTVAVFGCTAVEGKDPISDSNRTAWTLGFVSALFVIGTIGFYFLRFRKARWTCVLSIILFIFHPAWWLSAWGGDCGMAKVDYSKWFTGFLLLLTIYQGTRWLLTKRNEELAI